MTFYKHPTAVVESNDVGEGTQIWHFAQVRQRASIGRDCRIGKSTYIDTQAKIGDRVKVQNFASIYRGVQISDDVLIGPAVTFTNDKYPRAFEWSDRKMALTCVSKGASIGANSTIIAGVRIGEYAIVGAGSVVTKDVPSFTLVFGNPARIKGVACYCGKILQNITRLPVNEMLLTCECGKTVSVPTASEAAYRGTDPKFGSIG